MHNGAANYTLKVLRVQGETVGRGGVAVSHTWTEGGRKQWQAEWGAGEPGHMDCRSFRVVSTSSWSMWFFSRSTSSSSVCQQKLLLNNGSPDTLVIPNCWRYDGFLTRKVSLSPIKALRNDRRQRSTRVFTAEGFPAGTTHDVQAENLVTMTKQSYGCLNKVVFDCTWQCGRLH